MSLCQDAACPTHLPPDLQTEQTGLTETDRVGSKETEASSKGDYLINIYIYGTVLYDSKLAQSCFFFYLDFCRSLWLSEFVNRV